MGIPLIVYQVLSSISHRGGLAMQSKTSLPVALIFIVGGGRC